ncbi:hypothetical protein STCU_09842 [Strigomonas culicis]|nr:hypothetical protein STCU_09842 [Strigomonas culicis]|eukprot:EPY18635.1 hypothetical protein STCU_09842 [Strigomonas culicis]
MSPLNLDQPNNVPNAGPMDRGMAELIEKLRHLHALKAKAVREEDYDVAAALKGDIDTLGRAKEAIAALEHEKKAAVQCENYARAKQIKQQIYTLLNSGYETEMRKKGAPPVSTKRAADPTVPAPVAANTIDNAVKMPVQPQYNVGRTPSVPSKHDETKIGGRGYYDVDDALKNKDEPEGNPPSANQAGPMGLSEDGKGAPWERKLNQLIKKNSSEEGGPAPLDRDAVSLDTTYEKDFGIYCAACLLGRKGTFREAAIKAIACSEGFKALTSHTTTAADTLLIYLSSNGHGVSDPVAGVVLASCDAVTALVSSRLSDAPSLSHMSTGMSMLVPQLVSRLGDANNRVRESVEAVLVRMARSSFGSEKIVTALLVDPDKQGKKPAGFRAHLSRIKLFSTFVDAFGVDRKARDNALDVNAILSKVVIPSLQHSNGEVREAAIKLFAKLVVLQPKVAKPYMDSIKPAQQSLVEAQIKGVKNESDDSTDDDDDDSADMETDTVSVQSRRPSLAAKKPTAPIPKKPAAQTPKKPAAQTPKKQVKSAPPSRPSESASATRELRTCQFCGEYNASFTEANLDMHYVRSCPMLCPCPLCDQVTEICTLQKHLVSECEGRDLVKECPRCHEAVRAEELRTHLAAKACIEAVASHSICPLCHARFKNSTAGWRTHLAKAPGCANNPRKYDGSGPVQ